MDEVEWKGWGMRNDARMLYNMHMYMYMSIAQWASINSVLHITYYTKYINKYPIMWTYLTEIGNAIAWTMGNEQ